MFRKPPNFKKMKEELGDPKERMEGICPSCKTYHIVERKKIEINSKRGAFRELPSIECSAFKIINGVKSDKICGTRVYVSAIKVKSYE